MSAITILEPEPDRTIAVQISPGSTILFSFEPSDASFTRNGSDLVLIFDNGAQVRLVNFFAPGEDRELPFLQLPDGSIVEGAFFLSAHAPGMDLSVAARPESLPGSGLSEYAQSAGELLDGVDRLGSLAGLRHAASAREVFFTDPLFRFAGTGSDAEQSGTNPGTPFDGPYSARAVLYMTGENAADVLRFGLVGADGKPVADPGGLAPAIISKNGLVDVSGGSVLFDTEKGVFTLRLTESGKAALLQALAAAGNERSEAANVYDYLAINFAGGNTYVMQVVLNQSGDYNAGEENALYAPGGALAAEWHNETDGSGRGERVLDVKGGGIFFNGEYGLYNGNLDAGSGSGTAYLTGKEAGVYADKASSVTLEGGLSIQSADTGVYAGADAIITLTAREVKIVAASESNGYGLFASKGGTSTLEAREGITISAACNDSDTYGVLAFNSGRNTLTAGEGISINAACGTEFSHGIAAIVNGHNTLTAGKDIHISAQVDPASSIGMEAYTVYARSGENEISGRNITITSSNSTNPSSAVYALYGGTNRLVADATIAINAFAEEHASTAVHADTKSTAASNNELSGRNIILTSHTDGSQGTPKSYGVRAFDTGTNTITAEESITISAFSKGTTYGMYAEEGANTLAAPNIALNASGEQAYGMYAKGGSNTINGLEGPYRVDGEVHTGAHITIGGNIHATGGGQNVINGTAQEDYIRIEGSLESMSGENSLLLGEGNDTLIIRGGLGSMGTGTSSIMLGDGDDILIIDYSKITKSFFDGGDGANDVLQLNISNSPTAVADIFGTSVENSITGFESLLLNLDNETTDTINLDALLKGIAAGRFSFSNGVYINKDESDTITGLDGWTILGGEGNPETVVVNGITYNVYTHAEYDDVDVYVQVIGTTTG